MASLPVDNTARYKLFYTNCTKQHVVGVRVGILSPSAFGTIMDTLFTQLTSLMFATVINDVQFAGAGSNIFNSVGAGINGNTYGSGTPGVGGVPNYIDFVGRSAGGRRVRMAIFGINTQAVDFRFISGENANVDGAIGTINAAGNCFFSIDGVKPVWKNYANAGLNAYWQRKVRP